MPHKIRILLLFFILLVCNTISADQWPNYEPNFTEGTDFWVTFMQNAGGNAGDDNLKLTLYATPVNNGSAEITITNPNTQYKRTLKISNSKNDTINIPNREAYTAKSETSEKMGLHITSNVPISLYMCNNHGGASYDASLVLPYQCIHKEYIIQTYSKDRAATEFVIIATKDNTNITIIPSANTSKSGETTASHKKGEPIEISLNYGMTYLVRSFGLEDDLTGTTICSNKPIAVFNGNQHTGVPSLETDDHLVEQAVPDIYLGTQFAITKTLIQDYNAVRITAIEDNTIFKINGSNSKVINSTESYNLILGDGLINNDFIKDNFNVFSKDESCYIESSKPIICYLYLCSRAANTNRQGDPSMVYITPQEQAVNHTYFTSYKNNSSDALKTYLNLVTTKEYIGKIKLDNSFIAQSDYSELNGNNNLFYVRKEISNAPHQISGGYFTAYTYGLEQQASYATSTGFNNIIQSEYMLIDGERKQGTTLCAGNSVKFEAVTNYEYNNLTWKFEDDTLDQEFHNKILTHQFDTAGIWRVLMIVDRKSPICKCSIKDTVYADIVVRESYNFRHDLKLCECDETSFTIGKTDPQTHNRNELKLNSTKIYTETGLKTIGGCDSIVNWYVYYGKTYPKHIKNITICSNSYYEYTNKKKEKVKLTNEGTFIDTLATVRGGCDSIVEIHLTVKQASEITDTIASICTDSFFWHGDTIIKISDKYVEHFDTLISKNGCDSIVRLKLTFGEKFFLSEKENLCPGGKITWHGRDLDSTGVYYDSLVTTSGCDSIYQMILYVADTTPIYVADTICQYSKYTHLQKFLNTDYVGTIRYRDTIESSIHCDSIIVLDLTITPIFRDTLTKTISDKGFFIWEQNGKKYESLSIGTHFYEDKNTTQDGCDSIFVLQLIVEQSYFEQIDVDICEKESFEWRDSTYSNLDVGEYYYFDSLIASNGQDSIHCLHLSIHPTYHTNEVATICDNEIYYFHGTPLTFAIGHHTRTDTLTSQFGCDSIVTLNIDVLPTYLFLTTDTVCTSSVYSWHGKNYYTSGTYFDSLKTKAGCDSVFAIKLTIRPSYNYTYDASICDNQSYDFEGYKISEDGEYKMNYYTREGCDSTKTVRLHVEPTYFIEKSAVLCGNNTYDFNGRMITEEGIYYDTLTTKSCHCDSIIRLSLTKNEKYNIQIYDTVCQLPYYIFNGKYLTDSGVYSDTLITQYGCDSIITLHLSFCPTYLYKEQQTICYGENIKWRNKFIDNTKVGTQIIYDSLKTVGGSDSVYQLTLTVLPRYRYTERATICETETYNFHGINLAYKAGQYTRTDTLLSHEGCDSVVTLQLTVISSVRAYEIDTACSQEPYYWHGQTYYSSGNYFDTLTAASGCDSIVGLQLFLQPQYNYKYRFSVCDNKTFSYNNIDMSEHGNYRLNYYTKYGCDSIIDIEIINEPSYLFIDSATICPLETYNFRGRIISEEGIYFDSLKTSTSCHCDSVYMFRLKHFEAFNEHIYDTICRGDTYSFGNQQLTETGEYTDTIIDEFGCTHITHLHLTQVHTTITHLALYQYCADDQIIDIDFQFEGLQPKWFSAQFDDFGHKHGLNDYLQTIQSDYITLELPQGDTLPMPPRPYFDGNSHEYLTEQKFQYIEPNNYRITISFYNGYCEPDINTTLDTIITIIYPSWIIEQHWNDAIVIYGDKYNGGYKFSHYQWYKDNQPLIGETNPHLYNPHYLDFDATYFVLLTRESDTLSFPTCPITPILMSDSIVPRENYVSIVPTLLSSFNPHATILSTESGTYTILDAIGNIIQQNIFEPQYTKQDAVTDKPTNVVQTDIIFPNNKGLYLVRMTTKSGYERTQKVIVQ